VTATPDDPGGAAPIGPPDLTGGTAANPAAGDGDGTDGDGSASDLATSGPGTAAEGHGASKDGGRVTGALVVAAGGNGGTSPPAPWGAQSMAPMPTGQSPGRRRPDWLVGQLPIGMLEFDFFYRFASIFQEEAGTYLDTLDTLPYTIDPAVAPLPMVRFLGSWLGLPDIEPSLPERQQRQTVMEMAKVRWWRGTKKGLTDLLALLTGGAVEVTDESGIYRSGEAGASERRPRVTVRVQSTGWLSEPELAEVVLDEVPAHASTELYVGERKILPMANRGAQ